jgi:antitoxin component HigA of HigAB toxin-antitoxin module
MNKPRAKTTEDKNYELILEQERLLLEATELVEELMENRQVNRSELAALLGKSKAHVTQLLSGDRNLTLRTLAELAFVLDERVHLQTQARTEAPARWYSRTLRTDVPDLPSGGAYRAPDFVWHWVSPSGERHVVIAEVKTRQASRNTERLADHRAETEGNRRCSMHGRHCGSQRHVAATTEWRSLLGGPSRVTDDELGLCSA